jgi:hypothetical protein
MRRHLAADPVVSFPHIDIQSSFGSACENWNTVMTTFRNRDNRSSVAACETAGISSNFRRPATKTSNIPERSFKVIRDIAFTAFRGFQIDT